MTHAERIVSILLENEEQTEFPFGLPSRADIDAMLKASMISFRAEQEKEHGKPIEDYSVSDHGVMQSSYWQGAGTAFTDWDEAITGIGMNAHEALDDAINSAAEGGFDTRSIENEFNPDEGNVAGQVAAEANPDMDPDEASEDSYYYVVLYVKAVPPIGGEEEEIQVEEAEQREFPLGDPIRHSPETAELLKDVTSYVIRQQLKPGDEACSGTCDIREIIESCLYMLQQLHPAGYDQSVEEWSDELAWLKDRSGLRDDTRDDTLHEFQDRVFDRLSEYCPPYTYFGFYEADNSVGCWPNRERIDEEIEEGSLTALHQNSPEHSDFIQGRFVPDTEYTWIWDQNNYNGSLYRSKGAEFIWHW